MTVTLPTALLILLCLLVGGGILGCLILFASLKAELAQAARRAAQQQEEMRAVAAAVHAERTRVEERLQRLEQQHAGVPSNALVPVGMSQNRRSQALCRARLGEPPEQIAEVLQMPRNEVKLLLKVQQLLGQTEAAS